MACVRLLADYDTGRAGPIHLPGQHTNAHLCRLMSNYLMAGQLDDHHHYGHHDDDYGDALLLFIETHLDNKDEVGSLREARKNTATKTTPVTETPPQQQQQCQRPREKWNDESKMMN